MIEISRKGTGPIIHQAMHPSLGDNINGPSLIRVPDGIKGALGQYYLYFSHHKGQHKARLCRTCRRTVAHPSLRGDAAEYITLYPEETGCAATSLGSGPEH